MAAADLGAEGRAAYFREIVSFLRHCKVQHSPATVELAKGFVESREREGSRDVRAALRWWFRAARSVAPSGAKPYAGSSGERRAGGASGSASARPPPLAREDLGATPWERALIKASRERGFLWRTEPRKAAATRLNCR